jgi:hypothetical protein
VNRKRLLYFFGVLIGLILSLPNADAQSNLHEKTYYNMQGELCFDSLNPVWSSIQLLNPEGQLKEGEDYNWKGLCVTLLNVQDTLVVHYRKLELSFPESIKHKDRSRIEPTFDGNVFDNNNKFTADEDNSLDFFSGTGLNAYGNMSRGIGFGNNQNLVVNSNLNLQINGKLGSDIEILAAVSDENNPIQPEGNTQQLQDFDKVFIRLSKQRKSLTIGDFVMKNYQEDYFLRFMKKSRGLQYQSFSDLNGGELEVNASAAVSRGRFARNEIAGQEGNQGPYQLRGTNGEIFIIVISGTERVYLDGKLLKRGENNDYTIDYNRGEITFTATSLITQYSRIIVEFQYSDRNYSRSILRAGSQYKKGKWSYRGNYFIEQDNKNQPFQQSLDLFDSLNNKSATQILSEAGDNSSLAVIGSFDESNEFNVDRINYRRKDTLGFSDVYIYSPLPNEDSVFYQVNFSFVGQGNGNYIPVSSAANGRVYEFIEPISGVSQGSYEPVIQLVSPVRYQMYSGGVNYDNGNKLKIGVELAGTDEDRNTFSSLDGNDNNGWAGKLKMSKVFPVNRSDSGASLSSNINYEHVQKNFRSLERFRDVEFDRKWNRQLENPSSASSGSDLDILSVVNTLAKNGVYSITSDFDMLLRADGFTGLLHSARVNKTWKSVEATVYHVIQRNEENLPGVLNTSDFDAYGGELSKRINKINLGIGHSYENSVFEQDTTSLLGFSSYSFNNSYAFVNYTNPKGYNFEIRGALRKDFLPDSNELVESTTGKDITFHFETKPGLKNVLTGDVTWRQLQVHNEELVSAEPEDNVLSKLQYRFRWLKNSISGNTFLQIGTGREQKQEFSFIEVPAGNGSYTWNDYNENGIKELNEFELAIFQDKASYIRVFVPTNEFVKSNTNELNQTLRLQSPVKWRRSKGLKKLVSRFNIVSAVKLSRKVTDNDFLTLVNPFNSNIDDESLIFTRSFYKNSLFFNRMSSKYGLIYTLTNNNNKLFLTNGFDNREEHKHLFTGRLNFGSKWTFNPSVEFGSKSFGSEFFPARNFDFSFEKYSPSVDYLVNMNLRFKVGYSYYQALNNPSLGGEETFNHEGLVKMTWNVARKGNLNIKFSYIEITYNGSDNNSLSYEMLSGLTDGTNVRWNVDLGKMFSNHIQLTAGYEGRKSGEIDTVHVGSIRARYLF